MVPKHRLGNLTTWRRVIPAAVLVALGVLCTLDAWTDIVHIALRDEEANQVFLVPVVAGWLFWVRRRRLRHCSLDGTWLGPIILALGWLFYSVGDTQMWQAMSHGGAVLVLVGCLVTIWGKDLLIQFLPAFIALLFVIPVPGRIRQQVSIPMATVTAQITQHLFELIGMPVGRSGNLLVINGTDVAIAEACNGLRMAFALGMVSFTFAFATPLRWYVRLLVLAASPISAIGCNVIRLVPTVWLYGYYPGTVADTFHSASGWVMLVVAFLILMGIVRFLRWALVPVTWFTLAYD